jgi:hypothetical protein
VVSNRKLLDQYQAVLGGLWDTLDIVQAPAGRADVLTDLADAMQDLARVCDRCQPAEITAITVKETPSQVALQFRMTAELVRGVALSERVLSGRVISCDVKTSTGRVAGALLRAGGERAARADALDALAEELRPAVGEPADVLVNIAGTERYICGAEVSR